jgi:hypothetical protein
MTAVELLRELETRGVRVVVRGDRLSLRGPATQLTQELTERLRQYKPQILEAVRHRPTCCECGAAIGPDEPECWWGVARAHFDCGRRAWARQWKGEALPADTPWAIVH